MNFNNSYKRRIILLRIASYKTENKWELEYTKCLQKSDSKETTSKKEPYRIYDSTKFLYKQLFHYSLISKEIGLELVIYLGSSVF